LQLKNKHGDSAKEDRKKKKNGKRVEERMLKMKIYMYDTWQK
jgi:hypothetical protein